MNLIDPSGWDWIYSQSTGQLSHTVDGGTPDAGTILVDTGFSGADAGYNNPAMQDVPNVGPIPRGVFILQPQQDYVTSDGVTLYGSLYITMPDGGKTLLSLPDGGTRSGFLVHGGTVSHGCIVLKKTTRNKIGQAVDAGDRWLQVVH